MKEIDWKRKLTSRKFWTAVAAFVSMMVVANGGTENTAAQVTALIMAGASVVAYIIGEGLTDSANADTAGENTGQPNNKNDKEVIESGDKAPDIFLSGEEQEMTEKRMFDILVRGGLSELGAAVLMGHFKAESAFNPRNLQNSMNKKLDMTDDEYTAAVDSGAYQNFVHDSAGYGYAQWTFWSRKQALLDFTRGEGCSVGDPEMQLKFALHELEGYKTVLQALKTGTDIRTVSDIVLKKYEKPADQSEKEQEKRAGYAQEIYDKYASQKNGAVLEMTEAQARQRIVQIASAWLGKKESDGSHKEIIDIYNGHIPLARGYQVKYTDAWCAVFGSAVAIIAGYTDIIPTECSCGQMIEAFKALGRWIEDDAYVPDAGDYIFYDWDDDGTDDCTGWPEHVGIVASVSDSRIRVIEGNKSNAVDYRDLDVNGQYIRGYGIPDYASKAAGRA